MTSNLASSDVERLRVAIRSGTIDQVGDIPQTYKSIDATTPNSEEAKRLLARIQELMRKAGKGRPRTDTAKPQTDNGKLKAEKAKSPGGRSAAVGAPE